MRPGRRPKLAVFKFASCDGCQLSLLNCEDELLAIAGEVEIASFLEASRAVVRGPYDLTLVEGIHYDVELYTASTDVTVETGELVRVDVVIGSVGTRRTTTDLSLWPSMWDAQLLDDQLSPVSEVTLEMGAVADLVLEFKVAADAVGGKDHRQLTGRGFGAVLRQVKLPQHHIRYFFGFPEGVTGAIALADEQHICFFDEIPLDFQAEKALAVFRPTAA